MIYINNKTWLTLQHIKVQNFDYVGVGVAECLNASTWAKGGVQSGAISTQP